MKIHYLQHVPFEGLGSIEDWIRDKGHKVNGTKLYLDEHLPDVSDFDWLIIMGGPMSIYQYSDYPWLKREKDFIRETIGNGAAVLGICLGAQMIANALDAGVLQNDQKEIGWYAVRKSKELTGSRLDLILPPEFYAFHWHGDTFDLPAGSTRLASSDVCENQGFAYRDNVIALQFHLESTVKSVRDLVENCAHELTHAPYIQKIDQMLADENRFRQSNELMSRILDYMESIHTGEN